MTINWKKSGVRCFALLLFAIFVMNEIAIGLVDGKIIATSEESMQEYKRFQTE